jgi:DNA-directed RNA polymerase sigma subunit (sigma70/sigma32)
MRRASACCAQTLTPDPNPSPNPNPNPKQELGREPSDAELAARLGMAGGAREYRERLSACRRAKHTLVQSNLRLVYSVAG